MEAVSRRNPKNGHIYNQIRPMVYKRKKNTNGIIQTKAKPRYLLYNQETGEYLGKLKESHLMDKIRRLSNKGIKVRVEIFEDNKESDNI